MDIDALQFPEWLGDPSMQQQTDYGLEGPEEGTPVEGYRIMRYYRNPETGETKWVSPLIFLHCEEKVKDRVGPDVLKSTELVHNTLDSSWNRSAGFYYLPDRGMAENYMKAVVAGVFTPTLAETPLQRYENTYELGPVEINGQTKYKPVHPTDDVYHTDDELNNSGWGLYKVRGTADLQTEMDTGALHKEGLRMNNMEIDPDPVLTVTAGTLGRVNLFMDKGVAKYQYLKKFRHS